MMVASTTCMKPDVLFSVAVWAHKCESLVMGEPCRKCKGWRARPGDTWCTACSAWETLGVELCGDWKGPVGLRSIANDLVLNCAREVRALRALGAGFDRAPEAKKALTSAPSHPAVPAAPAAAVTTTAKAKANPPSEYTYEESGESEEEGGEKEPKREERPALPRRGAATASSHRESAGKDRPSTAVKEERVSEERKEERKRKERDWSEERIARRKDSEKQGKAYRREDRQAKSRERPEKDKEKKKKKRKRGGRKHKRLQRLATDPFLPHHRSLPKNVLDDRDEL